jgi:hypothetical protein
MVMFFNIAEPARWWSHATVAVQAADGNASHVAVVSHESARARPSATGEAQTATRDGHGVIIRTTTAGGM